MDRVPEFEAGSAEVVTELLCLSLERLHTDREAAAQLITRACSVLQAARNAREQTTIRGGLAGWQVRKLKAYIEGNLDKSLAVPELSELVRLSPTYFHRAFKKSFRVSPHAFILGRRIERAQALMLSTQEPLAAIALAVGFCDQSHLTRRFQRATGVTPSVWCRERRGDNDTRDREDKAA